MEIENRKKEHILISIEEDVEYDIGTLLDGVQLVHNPVPEIDLGDVELETDFLGHELSAPVIIAGMTGGHPLAKKLNSWIAEAVEELGLGMGVGSQRAGLENPELEETYSIVREKAPTAFVMGNIGASQVVQEIGEEDVERLVEMVEADAIAVHLNPLQEAVQVEGEPRYKGLLERLREFANACPVPVVAKETGAGMPKEAVAKLEAVGVRAIDVGGAGGTSFSKVEYFRAKSRGDLLKAGLSKCFANWGIPTALSIIEARSVTDLPVIATGGIRSGLEAAKALRLGADLVGIALPVMRVAYREGLEGIKKLLKEFIEELRIALFLTGSRNVRELRERPVVLSRDIVWWIEQRGIEWRP